MWFLHRLDPQSAAYNVLLAVRVRTPLDTSRLAAAVAAVQARHEMLRSTFTEVHGLPWRKVCPAMEHHTPALAVRDVSDVTHEHLGVLAQRAGAATFRLAEGELPFRVVLFRARPDDASLVIAAHHIVADASSLALILRDLLTAYRDLGGRATGPFLSELVRSYDDYVAWERELLASPKGARLAAYWQQVCRSGPPARLLPDKVPPVRPRHMGASCEVELPRPSAVQLRTASRDSGTTPFAYLLGAYQAMLYRCTSQPRFLIGSAATLRFAAGLRAVVGPMVNTVPLAASFDRDTTVADTVAAASRQVARAMVNAPYPLSRMAAGDGASAGQDAALFRTTLTLLAVDHMEPPLPMAPAGAPEGAEMVYAGLRIAHLNIAQQEGQFDLSVELRHSRSSVTGVFRYDVDLFERSTIERLAGLYCRFVHHTVNQPRARVDDLPLVDPAELGRLLALGGN